VEIQQLQEDEDRIEKRLEVLKKQTPAVVLNDME
jgi:hypothetical protein